MGILKTLFSRFTAPSKPLPTEDIPLAVYSESSSGGNQLHCPHCKHRYAQAPVWWTNVIGEVEKRTCSECHKEFLGPEGWKV